jgi:hypothetical protein
MRALVTLLAIVGLGACSAPQPTVLDIHLKPTAEVNDPDLVARMVGKLKIVIDSVAGKPGLYPEGFVRDGGVSIRDDDGDKAGEAVLSIETSDRLPWIRVEQGGLAVDEVELRATGTLPTDEKYESAAGDARARFVAGQVSDVEIPFNLRPAYRPPMVTQVIPADNAVVDARQLGSVFVSFSTRMNESLVSQAFSVTPIPSGKSSTIIVRPPPDGKYQGVHTAELRFAAPLPPGTYTVRVAKEATSAGSKKPLQLDQEPTKPDNQHFVSHFTVVSSSTTGDFCHLGGSLCPPGMACRQLATESVCQPSGCPAQCAPRLVCSKDAMSVCVPDCRVHGSSSGCGGDVYSICTPEGLCSK